MDEYCRLLLTLKMVEMNNIQRKKAGAETVYVVRRSSCQDDLQTSRLDSELEIDWNFGYSMSYLLPYVDEPNCSYGVGETVFLWTGERKDDLVEMQRIQNMI